MVLRVLGNGNNRSVCLVRCIDRINFLHSVELLVLMRVAQSIFCARAISAIVLTQAELLVTPGFISLGR